jgi:DNA mismatch repair protein MutS2
MFSDDFKTLEFDKFKSFVSNNFASVFAKEELKKLSPSNNLEEIFLRQNRLSEALEISNSEFKIPLDSDLSEFIKKLEDKFSEFQLKDFIIFATFFKQLASYKRNILDTYKLKYLNEIFSEIKTFKDLTDSILSKISFDGKIKNNASENLLKIRTELNEYNFELKSILNKILNRNDSDKFIREKVVTIRNNRFTILCKPNFRQYIEGIIQDVSDSKQTYFIEPSNVVEINNKYQQLKIEEDEEILKIIREIRDSILNVKIEIDGSIKAFSKIAFYIEISEFYKKYKFIFPNFSKEINLKNIHHPLLLFSKGKNSVPIDFEIKNFEKTIVISGPNTGGKTATLKSIGLNTLISKCGLPVFATSANFIFFDKIFADIGDHQSILMDFSTFSSHMLNIKRIIENSDENSLILFDELGTGTEPKEGAFLAVSILKYLNEKNITTLTTTHFSEVKHFAISKDSGIIYSVDFDYEKFIPSYKLLRGVEGKSDPFIVAEKLGFPYEIIEFAKELTLQNQSLIEMSLEEINKMKSELERKLQEISKKELILRETEQKITERENKLKDALSKKETELLEETYMLLNKAKSLSKRKVEKINTNELNEKLKKTFNKLKKLKSERETIKNINPNDIIFLEKYNKQAKVLRIEDKKIFVDMEGIKVSIPKNELFGYKVNRINNQKKVKTTEKVEKTRKSEIVIVGKNVEEAEEILDKFFDKQILSGVSQVAVIHGRGSGKLRKGVHEFLKKDPRVSSFRIAESNEGGQAVTIVNF